MPDSPNLDEVGFTEREGVYLVSTLTGSAYIIDFDTMTATRTPNPYDDDDEKTLRKDGEERPLLGISEIAIGRDMILLLDLRGDGVPTRRWTSPVIRIERLT
jgi:hypothetical protein